VIEVRLMRGKTQVSGKFSDLCQDYNLDFSNTIKMEYASYSGRSVRSTPEGGKEIENIAGLHNRAYVLAVHFAYGAGQGRSLSR